MRFIENLIAKTVAAELEKHTSRPDKKLTIEGYHPLPEIMGCLYEWIFIPFRTNDILVEVRYPRSTQLPDIDRLNAIIKNAKEGVKLSRQAMIDILNIQEKCCDAVLNRPTFRELTDHIYGKDHALREKKERITFLEERIKELPSGHEKTALKEELDETVLFTGFILPDDTMLALTNIALGIGVSDLQTLTEEKLVNAYFKAKLYKGAPHEFIGGLFTDRDREEIDAYATVKGIEAEAKAGRENQRRAKNKKIPAK